MSPSLRVNFMVVGFYTGLPLLVDAVIPDWKGVVAAVLVLPLAIHVSREPLGRLGSRARDTGNRLGILLAAAVRTMLTYLSWRLSLAITQLLSLLMVAWVVFSLFHFELFGSPSLAAVLAVGFLASLDAIGRRIRALVTAGKHNASAE